MKDARSGKLADSRAAHPDENDVPYKVGYRKPPIATQFKKGESGNPSGRAKSYFSRADLQQAVMTLFARNVSIKNKDGQHLETVHAIEGLLRDSLRRGLDGNTREKKLLFALAEKHLPDGKPEIAKESDDEDEAILRRHRAQVESVKPSPQNGNDNDDDELEEDGGGS